MSEDIIGRSEDALIRLWVRRGQTAEELCWAYPSVSKAQLDASRADDGRFGTGVPSHITVDGAIVDRFPDYDPSVSLVPYEDIEDTE